MVSQKNIFIDDSVNSSGWEFKLDWILEEKSSQVNNQRINSTAPSNIAILMLSNVGRKNCHVESNPSDEKNLKGDLEIDNYYESIIPNEFVNKCENNRHTQLKPIVSYNNCQKKSITISNQLNNVTFQDTFYKDASGKPIRKKKTTMREIHQQFEQCSYWDAFCTYICYFVLFVVGYANDLIRPSAGKENHRHGYVPLYSSFENFYTRHIYRRMRNICNMPICSVPGKYVTLVERETNDYGWTFQLTGNKNECINLGSYNYLGFAENVGKCAQEAQSLIHYKGVGTCSTRNDLGDPDYVKELEDLVARFVGTEAAITCAMGFATNALNIPSIMEKGCLVLSDEKNHASIILGLRLSGATVRVFTHNNMASLEKNLRDGIVNGQPRTRLPWKKVYIVVEGLYSMEGSIATLPEILDIKKKYQAYLYVDEAHSIGAIGEMGRGIVDYYGLNPSDVDILMGTFTKSFGSVGGYIAGTKELIRMLKCNSHSQCYGTTMTGPVAQQILTSMKIIMGDDGTKEGERRLKQLANNSRYFREKLKQLGFKVYMPSKTKFFISELISKGVATVGVAYPATPLTECRARLCISAAHTKEMLDEAISVMAEIGDNICVRSSQLPKAQAEVKYEVAEIEEESEVKYELADIEEEESGAIAGTAEIGENVCARSSKLAKAKKEIKYEVAELKKKKNLKSATANLYQSAKRKLIKIYSSTQR